MSGITYDYMEEYIRGLIPESEGRLKALEDFAKEKWSAYSAKGNYKVFRIYGFYEKASKNIGAWHSYWIFCNYNA